MDSTRNEFGNIRNYYSKNTVPRRINESKSEKLLFNSLLSSQKDLKQQVSRAYKRWNSLIRETLRNETGLRFTGTSSFDNVTTVVCDGFPLPFSEIINQYNHPELWRLVVNRHLLEQTIKGITLVKEEYPNIKNIIIETIPSVNEIRLFKEFLQKIIALTDLKDIDNSIININQDILGSYYFRVPIIHLYWQVIGFFSLRYGFQVDALTAVVLTHELAHAYTHIGKDIDKFQWDTEIFARADNYICEGLAQYYTEAVCKKLSNLYPQLIETYEQMLKFQSGPYLIQKTWTNNPNRLGEIIRLALIQTRNMGITDIFNFEELMSEIRGQITKHRVKQQELLDFEN